MSDEERAAFEQIPHYPGCPHLTTMGRSRKGKRIGDCGIRDLSRHRAAVLNPLESNVGASCARDSYKKPQR